MPFALTAVLLALGTEAVPVRVAYDAPSECPTAQQFYDNVRARTDHVRPAVGEEPRMDVGVRLIHTARGFTGEVREVVNDKESAVRSMDGETCKEVVEALSLTVALSIDPDAHAPTPPPASIAGAPPPAAPSPAPVTPKSDAATSIRLQIGLGVVNTVVASEADSLGGALSATVWREASPSTSRSLELALLFASTGPLGAPSDHRARFGALSLTACPWRRRVGGFELAPCGLGMFGVLEVTGRDIPNAKTVDRAWWSAGLVAQATWLLPQGWVVDGAFGGTLPLVRRRFYTNDSEHVIAETPALSLLARLGVGFRF